MREILFRGKRTDNGEWVEGNLYREESKTTFGDGEYSSSYITEICDVDIRTFLSGGSFFIDNEFIQVSDETVGQYTGLKDKNGKKIFEGDSLSITFRRRAKKPFEMHGTVIWEEETAAFSVEGFFDSSPQFLCDIVEDSEVIGNIHDNPELYNLV